MLEQLILHAMNILCHQTFNFPPHNRIIFYVIAFAELGKYNFAQNLHTYSTYTLQIVERRFHTTC